MESINTGATNIGTLATPLQSAAFVPMESVRDKVASQGNRFCKLIKKGEKSKLAASLAVEVPQVTSLADYIEQPVIAAYLMQSLEKLQDEVVKVRAIAGDKVFQYSELSVDKLVAHLQSENATSGIGQLSEAAIVNWFEGDAKELLQVALADRLGLKDNEITEADIARIEQIANQTRDNLKKLASKKPVYFDERVKKALNWALDSVDSGEYMVTRLRDKLNLPEVSEINIADALGL